MNLVVRAHRPWKSKFIWGIVLLGLLIGGWTLFDYGRFLAGYDSRDAGNEIEGLLLTMAVFSRVMTVVMREMRLKVCFKYKNI